MTATPSGTVPSAAPGYDALLAPILGPAYGYALSLTRNRADAEDLVQEAALQGLRGFGTFQPGAPFKPWFFRVLTNVHRMSWRARARRILTVSFGDTPDLFLYNAFGAAGLPTTGDGPADKLIGRLSQDAVRSALRRLPEEYRAVAALYFAEDRSYHEIAEVLGVPIGTVRSRLHRARKLLQKELWRVAEDAGVVSRVPLHVRPRGLDRAACEMAFQRINDFVDRELDAAEMARVREHLEVCALCSAEFAFEADVVRDVRVKLQRIDLPPDVRTGVERRLAGQRARSA